jgi:L-fucose isomerase-like protein
MSTTFGIIVGTRGFFPASLAQDGRARLLSKLEQLGYAYCIPPADATPYGAVETLADAELYADFFRKHDKQIDGIIVSLPNFGDELGVVETLAKAKLDVPVLMHAADDTVAKMDIANRRDSFCGKLSACNNLYQRNIPFTNTTLHTCSVESNELAQDIHRFAAICSVVRGLRDARIGMIGQRPDAFNTVRYSEKLLEESGIHISAVDMSHIIFTAKEMPDGPLVDAKIAEMKAYGAIAPSISSEAITRQAKLILTIENWVEENKCSASAIQCWDNIQKHYGCATCFSMSLMGEKGKPSACEVDITGAITMLALRKATGNAPGYLDWNNNYDNQRDKCICIHCSNYPKSFIGEIKEISNLDILGASLGAEKCFGAIKGQVQPGPMTFAKMTTDDKNGIIKMYVGEGEFTDDPVDTMGGVAVCKVSGLQDLLDFMCSNGFEHHVAMVRGHCAEIIAEACSTYMGWEVYTHEG